MRGIEMEYSIFGIKIKINPAINECACECVTLPSSPKRSRSNGRAKERRGQPVVKESEWVCEDSKGLGWRKKGRRNLLIQI